MEKHRSQLRSASILQIGETLHDTYRVEEVLGQGGMATVFAVSHLRLPRRFALKVTTPPDGNAAEFLHRFRREAEILAQLEHPNLISVFDWNVTASGQPYLVMELLSGEDLAHLLQRDGPLPQEVALSIFAQVAAALDVAHRCGVTHRDLKPANIFLCQMGPIPHFCKVIDFGIAKSAQHEMAFLTNARALIGTPAYMSPEQAQGNSALIDSRTDQFALGLVLYEMLSGRSAFYRKGEVPTATLYRVLTEDPLPLPDPAMNQVLLRALRKDPSARYPTLSAFVSAVMSCGRTSCGLGIASGTTVSPPFEQPTTLSSSDSRRMGELEPSDRQRPSFVRQLIPIVAGVLLIAGGLLSGRTDRWRGPTAAEVVHSNDTQNLNIAARRSIATPINTGTASRTTSVSNLRSQQMIASQTVKRFARNESAVRVGLPVPVRFVRAAQLSILSEVKVKLSSRGEAFVLDCIGKSLGVGISAYRGTQIWLEGEEELVVVSKMEPASKLSVERCMKELRDYVTLVPSVIVVAVR